MKKKTRIILLRLSLLTLGAVLLSTGQTITIPINGNGSQGAIALPDFRGSGDAQRYMDTFNKTLYSEIEQSDLFRMIPKTLYPLNVPQQPTDFSTATTPPSLPAQQTGRRITDWSGPPVNATYLTIGYTGVKDGQLVLFGWLFNASLNNVANGQILGKVYLGALSDAGARKVAQDFAADILKQFGGLSLAGTKITFVSDRTGHKEIWSMEYDGTNQHQITKYGSISTMPSVSPDGGIVAFTSYIHGQPEILLHSLATGRRLPFYNQTASMNATLDFAPDGKSVVFSSTAGGAYAQLFRANSNGGGIQRLTNVRAVEVEPKINPKTGNEIVFVSGRSGPQQIYKMNADGADLDRLTSGEGDASNPAWSPDGQHIAFAWTRGLEPGNFNIFVMDVATKQYLQLTHGEGRNENPTWAPDGQHLAFSSRRGRSTQIYTMRVDGQQIKPITTQGNNINPVWSK